MGIPRNAKAKLYPWHRDFLYKFACEKNGCFLEEGSHQKECFQENLTEAETAFREVSLTLSRDDTETLSSIRHSLTKKRDAIATLIYSHPHIALFSAQELINDALAQLTFFEKTTELSKPGRQEQPSNFSIVHWLKEAWEQFPESKATTSSTMDSSVRFGSFADFCIYTLYFLTAPEQQPVAQETQPPSKWDENMDKKLQDARLKFSSIIQHNLEESKRIASEIDESKEHNKKPKKEHKAIDR